MFICLLVVAEKPLYTTTTNRM